MTRAIVAAALAAAIVLAWAAPAVAHAELQATDPVQGAELPDPPDAITLTFTEGVDVRSDGVRVLDAAGEPVDAGRAEHPAGERRLVSVELPEVPDGVYVVTWRVTSSDSHPISGAFTFTVGEADADPTAALAAAVGGSSDGSAATGVAFAIVRFLAFAALILLVGGVAFVVALAPSWARHPRVRRALWGALVTLTVVTAAGIGIQSAYTAGAGLADAVDGELIGDVLGTRFGQAWLARLVLCGLAAVVVARLDAVRASVPLQVGAAVIGVGLLLTPVVSGHATTGDAVMAAVVADLVHLGAGAWWLAGLAFLSLIVLRPAARAGEEAGEAAGDADAVAGRFSQSAAVAVAVIVVTGAFQSWRQVRSLDGLVDTDFGRLLMAKVAAVAVLLAFASVARASVRRRLEVPLRRVVGAEAAIGLVVIALTAALVNAPPARSALDGRSSSGPVSVETHTSTLAVVMTVAPATVGPNDVTIEVGTHDRAPLDVPEVTARLTPLTNPDVGAIDVPVAEVAPGRWEAAAVTIPFAGDWRLAVAVRTSEIDLERVEMDVPVS